MSLQSKPYYWVICDEPKCGIKSTDGGDFTAWSEPGHALDDADASEWWIGDNDKGHFCEEHAPRCADPFCGNTLERDGTCADEHPQPTTTDTHEDAL